ncbi:MAG: TniQ family protein [Bacteroidota bacterium]
MLGSGDDLPGIPERSRLFHLEPMNIGKPNVESLASYTQRLIEAHSIDFDYFLQYEIYPNLGRQKKQFDYFSPKSILNTGWMIEGATHHYRLPEIGKLYLKRHRKATEKFIQVLENLTLRTHLERLTVMQLSNLSPNSGLLRRKLAWCPNCWSEWRRDSKPIYYPLLWGINRVVICPKHERPLRFICPYCEQHQKLLPSSVRLGYCSICNKWLSVSFENSVHSRIKNFQLKEKFDWHLWVSKSIEEILVVTSSHSKPILQKNTKESIISNLQNLKISKYRLSEKIQRDEWLNINCLLEICYGTNFSLVELLFP